MKEQLDLFREYLDDKPSGDPVADKKHAFIRTQCNRAGQPNTRIHLPLNRCHECTLFDKPTFNPHSYTITRRAEGNSMDVLFIGHTVDTNRGAFTGEYGELFRRVLKSIDFNFNYVFYNVCQCYAPKNRELTKFEIECCSINLEKVIKFFNPSIIVSLGTVAAKRLGINGALQGIHGEEFSYKQYKVIPTYHPDFGIPSRGKVHYREYIKSDLIDVKHKLEGTGLKKHMGKNYKTITSMAEFDEVFNILEKAKEFSFDIETTGLDVFEYQMQGIGFSWARGEGAYLPIQVNGMEISRRFRNYAGEIVPDRMYQFWLPPFMDYIMKKVKALLQNKAAKYGHKIKFDIKGIKHHWGFWVKNIGFDTKILYYLINENYANDLKHIVNLHYHDIRGYKRLSEGQNIAFGLLPLDVVAQRCVIDCDATLRIAQDMYPQVKGKKLGNLLTKFYNKLVFIYVDAELNGIKIDTEYVRGKIPELEREIKQLERDIRLDLKEPGLNLNSGDQLAQVLYEKEKYPVLKMTKKKTRGSVDKETLRQLFHDHGCVVAKKIRKFNILSDTLTRVFRGYTKNLDSNDRAHYEFHFFGKGNRLSTSKINIHNPTKIDWIRRMFFPEKNHSFICIDYSQLELRVLAWLSQDKNLLTAFNTGVDIHAETASAIFGIPINEVKKDSIERDRSKMLNFAVGTYGAMAKTGRDQINADLPYDANPIQLETVEKFKEYWDKKYSGACKYLDHNVQIGKTRRKLVTVFGHERRFDFTDFDKLTPKSQADYVNQMRNYVIQSTASTICQLALIDVWIWLQRNRPSAKFIMTLHDMIMVEEHDDYVEPTANKMEELMLNPVPQLSIKLKVDTDIMKFWK